MKKTELLKAAVIAWATIRMIQNFDDAFKRNRSVIKIADSLSKSLVHHQRSAEKAPIIESARLLEKILMQKTVNNVTYTQGHNVAIDPVSFVMYALSDNIAPLSVAFNVNFKHVDKLSNLITHDRTIDVNYCKKADLFLQEFTRLLDIHIEGLGHVGQSR